MSGLAERKLERIPDETGHHSIGPADPRAGAAVFQSVEDFAQT
jgi:hypothetical protein